ncbi:helix-turn-helix transcriptional regulator [Microcoleus sp. D3_18a_C4]|uniref:helix-turn-helix transcriptional regulator n=1 Tax=Microcoleus sp. D3_18a_C4 TaxID=3055332 RepID=UPI002FD43E92
MTKKSGEAFTKVLDKKGYSRKKLAKESGVDLSLISRAASGHTTQPTLENLRKLAQCLGMTTDELSRVFTDPDSYLKENAPEQQISDLKAEIKPFEEEYGQILTEQAVSSEIVDSEAIVVSEQQKLDSYSRSLRSVALKIENHLDIFGSYDIDALTEGVFDPAEKGKLVLIRNSLAVSRLLNNITVVFADTESLAHETGIICSIAYSKAEHKMWSGSISEKSKRNRAHARKNPHTLLLFKAENEQVSHGDRELALEWLGYTHVLPVNLETWNKYLDGEIGDEGFPSDYVASQEDEAYGLIVFSIALYRDWFSKEKYGFNKSLNDIQRLAKVTAYHLIRLIEIQFKEGQEIPILAQTDSRYISKFLERNGFIKHSKKSADTCPIYWTTLCVEQFG